MLKEDAPMGSNACCGITIGPIAGKAMLLLVLAAMVGVVHSRVTPIATLQPAQPAPIEALLGPKTDPHATPAEPSPKPEPATPAPANPNPTPAPSAVLPVTPTPTPVTPPKVTPPTAKADDALFVTLDQTRQLFERVTSTGDVVFVDARNAPEFAAGRIATAINLSPDRFFGGIPPELDAIAREFIVVVYCGGGECDASKLVAKRFNEQGYTKVYVFNAGYPAWVAAGLPVEK